MELVSQRLTLSSNKKQSKIYSFA